jgi:pullulanase/glycogen debranching enzyme
MATATLSQGPSLSQAGSDLLRSKSLDRNSYDSGDWFNAIHWDCRDGNGFGRGLPMAADNQSKWPYARPLLISVKVGCEQIRGASAAYRDLLRIRATEPVFSLATAGQVQSRLSFPLSGKDETPGVITMELGDLVVVLNATPTTQQQTVAALAGEHYALHPVQAAGADPIVKTASYAAESGTFAVPGRTVAVFTRGTREDTSVVGRTGSFGSAPFPFPSAEGRLSWTATANTRAPPCWWSTTRRTAAMPWAACWPGPATTSCPWPAAARR